MNTIDPMKLLWLALIPLLLVNCLMWSWYAHRPFIAFIWFLATAASAVIFHKTT